MTDVQIIKLGNEPDILEVTARLSLKAKHICVRITPTNQVELILPRRASFSQARNFLIGKELWIRNKLRKTKTPIPISDKPKSISIFGQEHELILNDDSISKPIEIIDNKVIISSVVADDKIASILTFHLKKLMKMEVEKYAHLKAQELDVKYSRISIKDTSSRWGSCSSSGALSFSWRLILAPRNVMEYVVVHELCHLIEMNHSHRFWNLVDKTYPQHHEARLWLKKNGKILHQII